MTGDLRDVSCRESSKCQGRNWMNKVCGSIPAPADMVDIPLFTWFYRSQVVSRIFSINSRMSRYPQYLDGFVLLGGFFSAESIPWDSSSFFHHLIWEIFGL